MVNSMTAFSRHEVEYSWGNIIWEIYSLNQRYLDINIELPKHLYELSQTIRKQIKDCLIRGKIQCTLQIKKNTNDHSFNSFTINTQLVYSLISSIKWIKTLIKTNKINPLDILLWPGVIIYQKNNANSIHSEILECFTETLLKLTKNREKEGFFLKNKISERLHLMYEEINKINQQIPNVLDKKRKKLLEQIQDVCIYTDPIRLEQELLLIAQKIDISEEIERLINHIKEIHHMFTQTGPIGRQLDFIAQELHREANTLTTKSINSYITKSAIYLKTLIEQIREQTQNIE